MEDEINKMSEERAKNEEEAFQRERARLIEELKRLNPKAKETIEGAGKIVVPPPIGKIKWIKC